MKKAVALFVAVAFAAGTAGFAAAQTTAPAAPEKKAEETKKPEAKKAAKVSAKSARGTVKSASADSLVVASKDKELTFAVDPSTKIKRGGKTATAADLKEGDAVTVKYTEQDGKSVAQTVTAHAAKAKKAEKKPATAPAEKPAAEKK